MPSECIREVNPSDGTPWDLILTTNPGCGHLHKVFINGSVKVRASVGHMLCFSITSVTFSFTSAFQSVTQQSLVNYR